MYKLKYILLRFRKIEPLRNYYKGRMDKIKGEGEGGEKRGGFSWGGVEGWGEKAYNSNLITNFF